jgi:hypothetical protein
MSAQFLLGIVTQSITLLHRGQSMTQLSSPRSHPEYFFAIFLCLSLHIGILVLRSGPPSNIFICSLSSEPAPETMAWNSTLVWIERCGSPWGSAPLWGWLWELQSIGTTTSATRGTCSSCAWSSTLDSGCTAQDSQSRQLVNFSSGPPTPSSTVSIAEDPQISFLSAHCEDDPRSTPD